jgi:AcrR family transcriptional regulator
VDTKEKILKAALSLFNNKGTEWTTVRDIAKKVGISHGNLCYHFPTTDHIIEQLYFNLVAELDQEMSQMQQATQNPEDVFKGGRVLFDLLYKYKFLMLNFVDIMRRLPKINKHFRELQNRRNAEFKVVFNNLVVAGMMRPEIYPGFFDDLLINMSILGDFWISHAEIRFEGEEKDKLDFYYRVTSIVLLPLLTEKGLALFLQNASKNK